MTELTEAIDHTRMTLAYLEAQQAKRPAPATSSGENLRVKRMAYEHARVLDAQGGKLTLGESLAIRRKEYGVNVQNSANLFGRKSGSEILYRDVPTGTCRRDDQPVRLTDRGRQLAEEYERLMGLGKTPAA